MAELLPILLLAIATNLDNFAIGTAYGLRGRRITLAPNLLIAVLNASATAATMLVGAALARLLPEGAGGALGGFLLAALGGWAIWDTWRAPPHPMGVPDEAGSLHFFSPAEEAAAGAAPGAPLGWVEAGTIALALSVSNLAAGVGAGAGGLAFGATVAAMFVFSLLGIWIGQAGGGRVRSLVPLRWAGFASGALLLLLGGWKLVAG